jgi:formyltetrahydrofolate-dependent phosphoribosylglycinamide formyltransferase
MSTENPPARLVVMISGSGTNLQALIDAIAGGKLPAQIVAVISNKRDAYGLERACLSGIPGVVKPGIKEKTREEYDAELAQIVQSYAPDWIVLAGWMRILSMSFLQHFPGRVINLHPSLPGTFPGTNAIARAYEAYQRGEITETGVMVHLVPDEGVDIGPVLAQAQVPIEFGESLEALEQKIHVAEHHLLVNTMIQIISKEKRNA